MYLNRYKYASSCLKFIIIFYIPQLICLEYIIDNCLSLYIGFPSWFLNDSLPEPSWSQTVMFNCFYCSLCCWSASSRYLDSDNGSLFSGSLPCILLSNFQFNPGFIQPCLPLWFWERNYSLIRAVKWHSKQKTDYFKVRERIW